MRRLILLRHAQAVRKGAAQDFARALSGRGRAEMAGVAAALAAIAPAPDLALVSPAVRTRETWALAGCPDVPVRFDEAIYDAEPETLLGLIRALPAAVGTAVLVGHNPGIEDCALQLVGPGQGAALGSGFPTAAFAIVENPFGSWGEVRAGAGRLVRFATPASLAGAA